MKILTFTGPSGVGKSTIRRALQQRYPELFSIVPMVTQRQPKSGDDGEYIYVTREEFDAMKSRHSFVATTRVPGTEERWYAYEPIEAENIALLVTDQPMLLQLREKYGSDLYSVGVLPPGETDDDMLAALHQRLVARGRDTSDQIADRLANAKEDIRLLQKEVHLWDHLCTNDLLEDSVDSIKHRIESF